ncbi:hypothetical protein L207DRAFT_590022 [Hyaloscypha variabilis F]|uniref:2EXR domain-containing protein n=1 Tax=Hyaloscypha variabilis (strain UAMH 11265 / GT02V1 / F) TaxID=1149755 RepID=A0A2J6R357_HYAVF|nr:hypothetical protein L207DRAFT_590022 [Hyaloscypha variabilis F]
MGKPQPTRQRLARTLTADVAEEIMADPAGFSKPVNMTRLQNLLTQLPKLEIALPSLTTFTIFPKLPAELRNKIWKYASMEPRDINLRERNYAAGPNDQPETPAILLTCHEARNEGRRYYTLFRELKEIRRDQSSFHSRNNKLDSKIQSAARICRRNTVWINFAVDRFIHEPCVQYDENLDAVQPMKVEGGFCFEDDVMDKIRHLALRFDSVQSQLQAIIDCEDAVAFLKNMLVKASLGKITLVNNEQIGKDGKILSSSFIAFDRAMEVGENLIAESALRSLKKVGRKLPVTIELKFRHQEYFISPITHLETDHPRSSR